MIINTNISELNTHKYLMMADKSLYTSMEQLSSGKRINFAKDDASGLAISSRMASKISGMIVAQRNVSDSISLIQTADGALSNMTNVLLKMRNLALQSSNETYSSSDIDKMKTEFDSLTKELSNISSKTNFNNIQLLNSDNNFIEFQIGTNANDILSVHFSSMSNVSLGIDNLNIKTNASNAITSIDKALDRISLERSNFGSAISRLEFSLDNLSTSNINLSASHSRIVDADFAKTSSNLTKQSVLVQSSIAMISQSNISPQNVLKLF